MMLRLSKPIMVTALLVGCAGQAAPETSETPAPAPAERTERSEDPEPDDPDEWSGLVDGDYVASHGWGHVYGCRVREVREGTPSSREFSLNAAAFGEDWLPENEQTPLRGVLMRFRRSDRPYGPPSGYRDPETSVYWVLVSATLEHPHTETKSKTR